MCRSAWGNNTSKVQKASSEEVAWVCGNTIVLHNLSSKKQVDACHGQKKLWASVFSVTVYSVVLPCISLT